MTFRIGTTLIMCLLLTTFTLAGSSTISASKDVYVRQGNSNNYNESVIVVKNERNGSSGNVRKGIIQFEFQGLPHLDDAKLLLDVTYITQQEQFNIWGVKDGHPLEDFDEKTTVDADWSAILDHTPDGTNNDPNALYDSNLSSYNAQPLGWLTIDASDLGKTVVFDGEHLRRWLEKDTNGIATIIITRVTQSSAPASFAAFEHETAMEPRLFLSYPDEVIEASADTYVRYGHNTAFGSETGVLVKRPESTTSQYNRLGVFAFDLDNIGRIENAALELDVSMFNNGSFAWFNLWAIADGSPYESKNIESLTINDMGSVFDTSWDCIINHSADLANDGVKLTRFGVSVSDLNQTVRVSPQVLTDLINKDTNGRIVLLLTRHTVDNSMNTGFASREHSTLQGPRLILRPDVQKYTSDVDFEVITADVDHDGYAEMVLVVNTPDGGGYTTADPWVMADFFYTSDYGFGLGSDFYDALSPTQQDTFQLQFANATATVSTSCIAETAGLPIQGVNIATFFDGLDNERQYNMETYTDRINLEAQISDGGVDLSASLEPCTLLDLQGETFFATVQGPSAQAAFTLKKGEFAMGAEYNAYTVTIGVQSESGSYGSISYSGGGGIFVSVIANDGGVGATFPFFFNTTLSFYLTAEDASKIEAALRQGLTDEFYDHLTDVPVMLFAVNDRNQRLSYYLERNGSEMSILVQDDGVVNLIILESVDQATLNTIYTTIQDVSNDTSGNNKSEEFSNEASTWDEVIEIFGDITTITNTIADAFDEFFSYIGSLLGG